MHISPTVTPQGGITGGAAGCGNMEILSSRSFLDDVARSYPFLKFLRTSTIL